MLRQRDTNALSLILARDLAERHCIEEQRRSGDWHNITTGRLLLLNSRIAQMRAIGVVPLFTAITETTP